MGQSKDLDINSAALIILGITSVEDLDSNPDLSQFENYALHPLNLNAASRRELLESGLFTAFQTAALIDHRQRFGEIFSWHELQTIGGFTHEYTEALKCFVTLEQNYAPSWREGRSARISNNFQGKVVCNSNSTTYALKDNFSMGNAFAANLAIKSGTFKGSAIFGNERLKIMAGDYYIRFGQGLVQDRGVMMTAYRTITSLTKKTTTPRPGTSYSCYGAARGFSATYSSSRSDASLYWDSTGHEIGTYFQYFSLRWGLGTIVNYNAPSKRMDLTIEARTSHGPFMAYTETGWAKKELATITGIKYRCFDNLTIGLLLKYTTPKAHFRPSELVFAHVSELFLPSWNLTGSFSYMKNNKKTQMDACLISAISFSSDIKWNTTLQWRARVDGYSKFLLKTDLRYTGGDFNLAAFAQSSCVDDYGFMLGCEAGWAGYYLKYAYWKALSWNDRLYLYLRSSPGSFNIPALYREGMLLSGYGKINVGERLAIYLTLYGIIYRASLHKDPRIHAQLEVRYRF